MVGLHLGAKCLVCVETFPATDRQEDTSAKLLGQFIPQYRIQSTPIEKAQKNGYYLLSFSFFFAFTTHWKCALNANHTLTHQQKIIKPKKQVE